MPRAVDGFKICSKPDCKHNGNAQPVQNFYHDSKTKDGLTYRCKDCSRSLRRSYCASPRGKATDRVRRYDISIDEALRLAQQTHCESCGVPFGNTKGDVQCIDHDHDTDKIRGVVCGACNRVIGIVGEDSDRLRKAADYLDRITAEN